MRWQHIKSGADVDVSWEAFSGEYIVKFRGETVGTPYPPVHLRFEFIRVDDENEEKTMRYKKLEKVCEELRDELRAADGWDKSRQKRMDELIKQNELLKRNKKIDGDDLICLSGTWSGARKEKFLSHNYNLLQKDNEELKKENEDEGVRIRWLEHSLAANIKDIEKLKKENKELKDRQEICFREIMSWREIAEEFPAQKEKLQKENENLKQWWRVAESHGGMRIDLDDWSAILNKERQLEEENEVFKKDNKDLCERNANLTKEEGYWRDKYYEAEDRNSKLNNRLHGISPYKAAYNKYKGESENLHTENIKLEASNEDLVQENAEMRSKLEEYRREIIDLLARDAMHVREISEMRTSLIEDWKECDEFRRIEDLWEHNFRCVSKSRAKLERENEIMRIEIEGYRNEIEGYRNEIDGYRNEIDEDDVGKRENKNLEESQEIACAEISYWRKKCEELEEKKYVKDKVTQRLNDYAARLNEIKDIVDED